MNSWNLIIVYVYCLFILCIYFPLDWEYILPLLILGAGFSQYGVSQWTGYAPKVLVNLKIEMILDKSEVLYNTFRLNQISGFNQNCSIG